MPPATLADFLLARFADDEATTIGLDKRQTLRLRAECRTKRRIVELTWSHYRDDDFARGMSAAKDDVLRLLGAAYADHPDYCGQWRPYERDATTW